MTSSIFSAARTKLGRYEIVGRIATGGMATVYLARLRGRGGFSREFALKIVHPQLADEPGFDERFLREARLASRVRHHNVVATIDAGHARGYSFLALELVDGVTLRQIMLSRGHALGAVEAAQAIADAARGLHALHTATDEHDAALDIVHRDLSPRNIMIDRHGRTVLIDLGLAKAREGAETTQVGVMIGKLPYMSPEQAALRDIDARSDVFALGTVLFELVTGELPFGETHTTATLETLLQCDPVPLAATLREHAVPAWLSETVLACLRADRTERFATAEALADALTQALQRAGHHAPDNRRRLADMVVAAIPEHRIVPTPGLVALDPRGNGRWIGARVRWAMLGAATVGALAIALPPAADPVPIQPTRITRDHEDVAPPPVAPTIPDAPAEPAASPIDRERAITASATAPTRRPKRPRSKPELKPNPYLDATRDRRTVVR